VTDVDDVTSEDINRLWWKAYNAGDSRTALLCGDALGNEDVGRAPDPDARREVEQIIRSRREQS
jgi:hypothetical protein